jgi:hypothetical protein
VPCVRSGVVISKIRSFVGLRCPDVDRDLVDKRCSGVVVKDSSIKHRLDAYLSYASS